MQNPYIFFNGELMPEQQAKLSIHDLTITRGYGIFDFFKAMDNTPLFIEDNLDRFYRSATLMDLPIKYNRTQLKLFINQLIQANNIPESGIKILLTGGYSKDGYSIGEPNLIISQQHLQRNIKQERTGISLLPFNYHRPLHQVKSIDYTMGIQALKQAKAKGADDVLYTQNGLISECPRANFFLINSKGTILTAPDNYVLQGVTRKKIIELARPTFKIEIRNISIQDVKDATEAFISSTTKNITPVHSILGVKEFSTGSGPITRQLQVLLDVLMRDTLNAELKKA